MHIRGVKMAKISKGNGRSQAVILPARAFRFEIEAILTSFGFDPFCPLPRWQARQYRHIPVAGRLALSKMASNLECAFSRS
jgi:hypothetical protein